MRRTCLEAFGSPLIICGDVLRQYFKNENGKRTACWALVESFRTRRGPRQRVVAWLGKLDEAGRLGVRQAVQSCGPATSPTPAAQRQFEFEDEADAVEPRWVMDRGMVSDENIEFLKRENRRYSVGTPKSMLKKFEQELLKEDWHTIRDGLEVRLCALPSADDQEAADDTEVFILCRSRDRFQKDEAILRRFEQRIEERLTKMVARCEKQNRSPAKVEREVGRLLGQNTRAAKLFEVNVETTDKGRARLKWQKLEAVRDWATLSAGCYLLRSNVTDWTHEDLWKTC